LGDGSQPDSTDVQAGSPFPAPEARVASQVMLAEYAALRADNHKEHRADLRGTPVASRGQAVRARGSGPTTWLASSMTITMTRWHPYTPSRGGGKHALKPAEPLRFPARSDPVTFGKHHSKTFARTISTSPRSLARLCGVRWRTGIRARIETHSRGGLRLSLRWFEPNTCHHSNPRSPGGFRYCGRVHTERCA
jgi:hypothetical protein